MVSDADGKSFYIGGLFCKFKGFAETFAGEPYYFFVHINSSVSGAAVHVAFFICRSQNSFALQRNICVDLLLLPEIPVVYAGKIFPFQIVIIVKFRRKSAGAALYTARVSIGFKFFAS